MEITRHNTVGVHAGTARAAATRAAGFFVCLFLLAVGAALLGSTPPALALEPDFRAIAQLPTALPPVASYDIEVALDAEAKSLSARQVLTYTNTTPEPIPDLVFHLYLNAFRDENSLFLRESGTAHRGYGWDPEHAGWSEVNDIRLADGTPLNLEEIEDGTLARAILPRAIAPGESLRVELEYRAQLPRVFARTGYSGDFFMVGQWFPKLGVWQDGGWNAYPFHANAEFYADFGDYKVDITVPAGFVTGATGLPISTKDNADGTETVRYQAQDVIDFAWTASPRFLQATRQVEDVELLYLYLPDHEWSVQRALDAAEAALRNYGNWYGEYPYPRLTVVDVPDEGQGAGGMEYPTLVTAGTLNSFGEGTGPMSLPEIRMLEMVIVHEVGHQWWQSMVATNEAEEPWLDEGLTEYSAMQAMDAIFGEETSFVESRFLRMGGLDMRRAEYLSNPDVPMYGRAWDFGSMDYAIAAYAKPALALSTLARTLGQEVTLDILHTYFQRYRFSHPTTEDFRAVAEEVSGQDLAWFFSGLVYGDGVLNYTVTAVDEHAFTAARQGELIVPTEVLVSFADGSQILEAWDGAERERIFAYPNRAPIRSAEIDPQRKVVVDLRWADNGLSRRLEVSAWLALVSRLLTILQNALLALGGL